MANPYVATVFDSLLDIQRLLSVAAGFSKPLEIVPGNLVSTEVEISRPETLVPLATGVVIALVHSQVLEFVGYQIAKAIGVSGRKREQFASSWMETVYFGFQLFLSYRVFGATDWYWPSGWNLSMDDGRKGLLTQGLPGVPPYYCTRDMRGYYTCEFGYYAAQFIVIFLRKWKKDHWEMVFHHAVTSALISLSYAHWHLRIGVIVMMLHNLFDPWLNIAKCAHYAFSGTLHVMADISFAVGAVTFLASRLVMYPRAIYFAWTHCGLPGEFILWDASADELALKLLLCFLYPIHVFWFYLILKVAKQAIFSGSVQKDERSDSEDEFPSPKRKKSD
mmetsp:Transcript_69250/g.122517  ORF Transcript_69250/g.122517 Transcript_69250/m.122517 type:complete len:334 (+) Transcript_69250:68-1069(+)|eukprot:CAMPEP_0197631848 /NCGR_PEP_ID=MMETSP1338-20131121/8879_1 /TAXON_ID=43686 ORGANISM="Pelagodinium beii, Strain RCC1491" /NCGR_SAMPLE_ID=MMETSP1338 /ASSEMBLY_ACC=CAM_ASM_000754 /LENGTH=333 /DNA_ID=CAMNT_0043203387 /DNA_START=68 /DNA_END=1069 /DNA_ORIENTATION=-